MQGDDPEGPWGPKPTPKAVPVTPAAPPAPTPDVAWVNPNVLPAESQRALKLAFIGTRGQWARIMLRMVLLYIPTMGFYRFWLRTDQRRFTWSSISVGGETLEYRGTARELLIGFLFAIAVYVPVWVAYGLVSLYAETLQAFASIPLFLFTFVFAAYASFRARRYRLTRTVFRGVRFWMDGNPWHYAWLYLVWTLLTIITLGIAWPWKVARLERYKMEHSYFGDLPGRFSGTGWGLMKALFWPALGLLLAALIPFVYFVALPVAMVILIPMIMVIIARWTISGMSFGPVQFLNHIEGLALLGPALRFILAYVIFWAAWCALGFALLFGIHGPEVWDGNFWQRLFRATLGLLEIIGNIGPFLLWMVIGMLMVGFIKSVLFDFPRMQRLIEATSLTNAAALDSVVARGQVEGAFGEGLADALGADAF